MAHAPPVALPAASVAEEADGDPHASAPPLTATDESLEANLEEEPGFDGDSAFDDTESNRTETTSLASAISKYREENGRTYHAYGTKHYLRDAGCTGKRLIDESHHLWTLSLDGKLFLAPIEDPQRILDIGCGTGIWVIDVAEKYPDTQVKGIDVSPIFPTWIPPNANFEVDDYNLEWLDVEKYDMIHLRELLGTVPHWPDLYQKVYQALKPGGWIDQAEPGLFFTSDYDTLEPGHPYHQWGKLMVEAGEKANMPFNVGPFVKGWLEDAGFINVTEVRIPWTIGKWSKDPKERELGMWNQLRLEQGIQDFCARRFHNKLGWKPEEVEVFCAKMRNAIKNPKLLANQWAYFIYGQKPPGNGH